MKAFDVSDQQFSFYYGDDFVYWRDAIEGVHEFLAALEAKKQETNRILARKGNTIVTTFKGETKELTRQEIEYSSATFNPFDKENVKLAN